MIKGVEAFVCSDICYVLGGIEGKEMCVRPGLDVDLTVRESTRHIFRLLICYYDHFT